MKRCPLLLKNHFCACGSVILTHLFTKWFSSQNIHFFEKLLKPEYKIVYKKTDEWYIEWYSLSIIAICCHSLSLVVTCCHSLSLFAPLIVTRCHLLSLVVTWYTTRLSFYKRSTFETFMTSICEGKISAEVRLIYAEQISIYNSVVLRKNNRHSWRLTRHFKSMGIYGFS